MCLWREGPREMERSVCVKNFEKSSLVLQYRLLETDQESSTRSAVLEREGMTDACCDELKASDIHTNISKRYR